MSKSFQDSLQRNINRVLQEIDSKCYLISYTLFMAVIESTPHNTKWSRGNLINDWHAAANSYSYAMFSPVSASGDSATNANSDSSGAGSKARVATFKPLKTFFAKDGLLSLTNSQPYAYRAEYLGWGVGESSTWEWTGKVAPYAMVRNSLTTVAALYR